MKKKSFFAAMLAAAVIGCDGGDRNANPASDFIFTVTDNAVTITGYSGVRTDVVIPSRIDRMPVVRIGRGAFGSGLALTSLTLPDSLTTIGDGALEGNQLTSVVIPNSVTILSWNAFAGNPGITIIRQ